ncbi:Hypothetical large-conductance mechanosensitive channel [Mycobacteroides abscessus subsp. abscessus]|nr:Hypothetical large-conductance mechanosensitive channel [Mycobacteroides abscessus subsp. abscessus]
MAAVVYFAIVKPYTALQQRMKKQGQEEVVATEVEVLTEIRDLLASNRQSPNTR